jgi:short-subunit dehydrogenase
MNQAAFKDNVVIVTGASSGIGRELAYQLAAQRASLTLAGRDVNRLTAAAERCRQLGAKALIVPVDLTRPEDCRQLIERTMKEYGRIDTLINNAGNSIQNNLEDYPDPSALEQMVQINYLGSAYCTFYALPYIKRTHGRIVAVSSLAGTTGIPGLSGYVASKHAMTGFFESLRLEMKQHGVSVTIVYPGSIASHIDTGFSRQPQDPPVQIPRGMMPVDTCARLILAAAAKRRRDLFMPPGGIVRWIKLMAPGLLEKMTLAEIEKDRAKRKDTPEE